MTFKLIHAEGGASVYGDDFTYELDGGCLVITDSETRTVTTYAPHAWERIEEDTPATPSEPDGARTHSVTSRLSAGRRFLRRRAE